MALNDSSHSLLHTRALSHAAFFWLAPTGHTTLDQVMDTALGCEPERDVAGSPNTRLLSRRLRNEGLPGVRELSGWLRVLECVIAWETDGASLTAQALARGADPANWSRIIRARTGRPWTEVRALGSGWCLAQLFGQCWYAIRVGAGQSNRAARQSSAA